jgi:hypothetical protein
MSVIHPLRNHCFDPTTWLDRALGPLRGGRGGQRRFFSPRERLGYRASILFVVQGDRRHAPLIAHVLPVTYRGRDHVQTGRAQPHRGAHGQWQNLASASPAWGDALPPIWSRSLVERPAPPGSSLLRSGQYAPKRYASLLTGAFSQESWIQV